MSSRKKSINLHGIADCYNYLDPRFGTEMQHYISPLSKYYINKTLHANMTDMKCYVIDLELLAEFRKNKIMNTIRYGLNVFNHPYNILNLEQFQSKKVTRKSGQYIDFHMKDIMDYCTAKGKPNVFIYDKSCSGITGIPMNEHSYEPEKYAEPVIKKIVHRLTKGVGYGRTTRRRNKTVTAAHKKRTSHKKRKNKTRKNRTSITNNE